MLLNFKISILLETCHFRSVYFCVFTSWIRIHSLHADHDPYPGGFPKLQIGIRITAQSWSSLFWLVGSANAVFSFVQGLAPTAACTVVFIILYFSSLAAAVWWAITTTTWTILVFANLEVKVRWENSSGRKAFIPKFNFLGRLWFTFLNDPRNWQKLISSYCVKKSQGNSNEIKVVPMRSIQFKWGQGNSNKVKAI